MVQLSNTRISHTVNNTQNTLSLQGEVTIEEDKRISAFNGSIQLDGNYVGNFYYNERDNAKYSKNFTDMDMSDSEDIEDFIDSTIQEIKEQIQ